MPYRETLACSQGFLLPLSLDELLPEDHPARLVAEFVAALDLDGLRLAVPASTEGRPRYRSDLLLRCWLYGFMNRLRSSRQLERACAENLAFIWLTGFARPDHNTLWRFYRDHRAGIRGLFRQTVVLAVEVGLVDFGLQAIDGTRVLSAGAERRTLGRTELARLRERIEAEIEELERQNEAEAEGEEPRWRLPPELRDRQRLRERIAEAMKKLQHEPERSTINLTDLDARKMRGAKGFLTGYNGQAVADSCCGVFVGMTVTTGGADTPQLLPMLVEVEATAGRLPEEIVADAGYYSGANVEATQNRGLPFYAPIQPPSNATQQPGYRMSEFRYDRETDTYTCPEGQRLTWASTSTRQGRERRRYQGHECGACPVRPACTSNPRGRTLERMPWADAVERHRQQMATDVAKQRLRQRRTLIEPAFGSLKEHLGLRRFLLHGLAGVQAEWLLAGCAYNLRKLYRYWWRPQHQIAPTPA